MMKNLFTIIPYIFLFLGVGIESFGQDPNKPDLRDGTCVNCRGNANNYSILNVYFSNAGGNLNDICANGGPYFISILYSSNANTSIHNFRLIADILKKDRVSDDILDAYYINHFVGTVRPCTTGTCIVTIPLPSSFSVDCNNEYYELNNPMAAWTNNSNNNLENGYRCQNYPASQCLNQPSIPIEVGTLAYSFGPLFACFEEDLNQTSVSFVITSLFGGNPTQNYNVSWEFKFPDGSPPQTATGFNPTVWNMEEGSVIEASMTVTQNTLIGSPFTQNITVPVALSNVDIIKNVVRKDSEEDNPTGEIEVTFTEGDYFFYWTSVDDKSFYSENARIEDLPVGTYRLTTFDNESGTCRVDRFEISARVLPVEFIYHNAHHNGKTRTSMISWGTGKEWESSHFEIERALHGLHFEKIGEVMAMGFKDSLTEYEFMDEDLPLSGGNVLYRLKQVDIRGNYTYSPVMSVRTSGIEFTSGVWRAYPNPTNGNQLRISLLERSQYEEEKITFRLIHPSAQSQVMDVASEAEMNEALAHMIGRLPKGVFVVEIQWGQKVEHIKVLKQ
jgi:hypothetical protein